MKPQLVTVFKDTNQGNPTLVETCKGVQLIYELSFKEGWMELLALNNNSTHKLCGMSDFLGNNKVDLGIRRRENITDGEPEWVFAPYVHRKGVIDYYPGQPMIVVNLNHCYQVVIGKLIPPHPRKGYVLRVLDMHNGQVVEVEILDVEIKTTWLFLKPRTNGIWIEPGNGKSPCDVKTEVEIIKLI